MAKHRTYEVTGRRARSTSLPTADGGRVTLTAHEHDRGATITTTHGFRETPEQRRARLESCPPSTVFHSAKDRARGGRGIAKRRAIREASE